MHLSDNITITVSGWLVVVHNQPTVSPGHASCTESHQEQIMQLENHSLILPKSPHSPRAHAAQGPTQSKGPLSQENTESRAHKVHRKNDSTLVSRDPTPWSVRSLDIALALCWNLINQNHMLHLMYVRITAQNCAKWLLWIKWLIWTKWLLWTKCLLWTMCVCVPLDMRE